MITLETAESRTPATGAARPRLHAWVPAGALLAALAALVVYVLRGVLGAGPDRLPGLDSGGLYVWEVYTRAAFGAGGLPHWNPYFFAGAPHLANNQTLVFYPVAWLLRWLEPAAFLGWMTAVHVWLGGAGALLLARVAGAGWIAAAVAAVVVALGGSMGGRVYGGHLLILYSVAYLPWALAFAILSVRRGRWLPHPGLVIVLALQFLAGYLQGSVYIAAAVCAYYAFSLIWPEREHAPGRLRLAAQLGIAAALAVGLVAFQLWPTMRLAAESARSAAMPYEEAIEGAWTLEGLATFFFPFHGAAEEPPHRGLSDRIAYLGWLPALLVPFAFAGRPQRLAVFFGLLAAAAILFASAEAVPLFRLHYALLPGMRLPGRMLFVAGVALAVVAVMGLDRLVTMARARQWARIGAAGIAAGALAGAAAAAVRAGSVEWDGWPMHGWPVVPLLAIGGLASVMALARWIGARPALAAALLVVAFDLTAFTAGATETVPLDRADTIREWLGPPVEGRALSACDNRVGASAFLLNGQPTLDGVAGMHLRDYTDWAYLARFGNPPPSDGLFRRIGTREALPARRDLLDMANTTRLVACEQLDLPALTLVSIGGAGFVYRNDAAWPRAVWTCGVQDVSRDEAAMLLRTAGYDQARRLIRRHYINVRFAPFVSDEERARVEDQYTLVGGIRHEETTWRYSLHDVSAGNALALMRDPAVEDTHGLDRSTGEFSGLAEEMPSPDLPRDHVVIGTLRCADRAEAHVAVADAGDGRLVATVDAPVPGVLFLSEPYYPERRAFVNGQPVPQMKANLAFTAISVPAGPQEVELRFVPTSFHQGMSASALTGVVWFVVGFRRRGGRRDAA